ncbi:MAG TPA: LAGLIDADG family homing endonuclease [Candidatus Paceibacterota bacterium]
MVIYRYMAQSFTSDRIIFEKGEQAKFIFACKSRLDITWTALSHKLNINSRSLRNWSKEEKRMAYDSAVKLSEISGVNLPKNIKILKWSDHLKNISVKGGNAHYYKYGKVSDESLRKKSWQEWWEKEGKFKNIKILQRKEIRIPTRDAQLAEFVGIMIGDGNITDYAITITLDTLADKEYILYVKNLLKKLFGINPKIYNLKKYRATNITIQRKNLTEFCGTLGLGVGDKIRQNLDIPNWIKENSDFYIACIRGLFDTDGCVFNHSYKVNGKRYNYIKIALTNKCTLVLLSVKRFLINLGFYVRITKDGNDIRIEKKEDVKKYMEIVGTSNQKFKNKIIQGDVSELA